MNSLCQHVCALCVANDVRLTYYDRRITLLAVLGHPLLDDALHLFFHCNFFLILQKPVPHHLKTRLDALPQAGLIILLEYSTHQCPHSSLVVVWSVCRACLSEPDLAPGPQALYGVELAAVGPIEHQVYIELFGGFGGLCCTVDGQIVD